MKKKYLLRITHKGSQSSLQVSGNLSRFANDGGWTRGINKINRLHERSSRIVNNDYESTYEEILFHNNCFSVHEQNIQRLATEIYKVANALSVRDFKNLFDFKDQYTSHFPWVSTKLKGKNLNRYFGAVIWNPILINIKTATFLNNFKNKIKSWKPECPCRLYKT